VTRVSALARLAAFALYQTEREPSNALRLCRAFR